jgi:hypothetical protein
MACRHVRLVRCGVMSMRRVRLTHWRGRTNTASGSWRPRASRSRVAVRAAAFVVAIVSTLALSAPNALAATKSSREFVPGGAHVLIWSTTSVADGGTNGTIVVTNLEVIAQVRALINALPLTNTLHHACPDDMMLPITLSFAASRASTPFTRVIFQLGGCPSAEVVQHGSIVLPTLGGPNLSSTYGKIKKLIG